MVKEKRNFIIFIFIVLLIIPVVYSIKLSNDQQNSFDWEIARGNRIKVYLNQHPYSEAIIKSIPEFEKLTGISVEYYISPETIFHEKVANYLENIPGKIDVTMVGVQYLWEFAEKNQIENLENYVSNSLITDSHYNFNDFHPKVLDTLRWNREKNTDIKNGNLWAIPMGFELSAVTYNQKIFSEFNLNPPKNFDELEYVIQTLRKNSDITPLGIRGINRWNSLLFGYMTFFYNYGLRDFKVINNHFIPLFNSPKSIEFHKKWINIMKRGNPNDWNQNSWYKLSADIGAGKTAMVFDSDLIGYSQNLSTISKEKGNLNIAPSLNFSNEKPVSGIWSWGLAINKNSSKKIASWLFIQFFTSQKFLRMATENYNYLSPPRTSILNSDLFANKVSKQFKKHILTELENSKVLVTPQPQAVKLMEIWVDTLHKIYSGEFKTIEEGLNFLNDEAEKLVNNETKVKERDNEKSINSR